MKLYATNQTIKVATLLLESKQKLMKNNDPVVKKNKRNLWFY